MTDNRDRLTSRTQTRTPNFAALGVSLRTDETGDMSLMAKAGWTLI
jgi:hypothetical protein